MAVFFLGKEVKLLQFSLIVINSMLADIVESRLVSKGITKHLTDVRGAPHIQYMWTL